MINPQLWILTYQHWPKAWLCKQTGEQIDAYRKYGRETIQPDASQTKFINMTYPEEYYGGAMELNTLVDKFGSNFWSSLHFFSHGGSDGVK